MTGRQRAALVGGNGGENDVTHYDPAGKAGGRRDTNEGV
jgi:hypothetical protein